MTEQLPPHELELMGLFDRDLTEKERDRLIALLSAHPELEEKYSFYLYLQDIELPAAPELSSAIRQKLVREAQRTTLKIRVKRTFERLFNGLTHPAITGPVALCLAFLVGYELTKTNSSSDLSLLESEPTLADAQRSDQAPSALSPPRTQVSRVGDLDELESTKSQAAVGGMDKNADKTAALSDNVGVIQKASRNKPEARTALVLEEAPKGEEATSEQEMAVEDVRRREVRPNQMKVISADSPALVEGKLTKKSTQNPLEAIRSVRDDSDHPEPLSNLADPSLGGSGNVDGLTRGSTSGLSPARRKQSRGAIKANKRKSAPTKIGVRTEAKRRGRSENVANRGTLEDENRYGGTEKTATMGVSSPKPNAPAPSTSTYESPFGSRPISDDSKSAEDVAPLPVPEPLPTINGGTERPKRAAMMPPEPEVEPQTDKLSESYLVEADTEASSTTDRQIKGMAYPSPTDDTRIPDAKMAVQEFNNADQASDSRQNPLSITERRALLSAKARNDINLLPSPELLRLTSLALKIGDLESALKWVEIVMRRNDTHYNKAKQLRQRIKARENASPKQE